MSYENLKIGKLVQTVLKPLIISKATKQEISKMQELEYSKATFGIQYFRQYVFCKSLPPLLTHM